MFDFIKDFDGNGFTIMHHGLTEHFSQNAGGDFSGDYGSAVWQEWDGSYKSDLVDLSGPLDSFADGAMLFAIVAMALTAFVSMIFASSSTLYSSIAYFVIAAFFVRDNQNFVKMMCAATFILNGYYQMGYCFTAFVQKDPFMTFLSIAALIVIGVLGIMAIFNLEAGDFAYDLLGVSMGISEIFLGITLLARTHGKILTFSNFSFMNLMLYAAISAIAFIVLIVQTLGKMSDKKQRDIMLNIIFHMFITTIVAICVYVAVGVIPKLLIGVLSIPLFIFLGYLTTHCNDNPHAARSGFSIMAGVLAVLYMWSQNVAPDEVSIMMFDSLGLGFIVDFLQKIAPVAERFISSVASPLEAVVRLLYPNLAVNGHIPVWAQALYTYCLIRIGAMAGIDIRFRIYYQHYTGRSFKEDMKKESKENVPEIYSVIQLIAVILCVMTALFGIDKLAFVVRENYMPTEGLIRIIAYILPFVVFGMHFSTAKTNSIPVLKWILTAGTAILIGLVTATCQYDIVGHSSAGAGAAWKQFFIALVLAAIGCVLGEVCSEKSDKASK